MGQRAAEPAGPDTQAYSELTGLPMDQAGRALADEILFENLATKVSLAYPDLITLYGFDGDDRTPWISMTKEPTAGILEEFSGLPFDTVIRYGASSDSAELSAAVSLIADKLEMIDRVEESTGGVKDDPLEIVIEYEVKPGVAELSDDEVKTILTAVARQSADGLLPVPITIRPTEINIEPEVARRP